MSDDFANLIGKALNTPPTGTITLILNKKVEFPNMDGRIIKPISLKLDNPDAKASHFHVLMQAESKDKTEVSSKTFVVLVDNHSKNPAIGTFPDVSFHIPISWLVFATLINSTGQPIDVKTAVFEYTFGTPF